MPAADQYKQLKDKWLTYAKQNGIKAGVTDGRPPEDTDLAQFLATQEFDEEVYQPLINDLPEVEPTVEPPQDGEEEQEDGEVGEKEKPEVDIPRGKTIHHEGNLYKWIGRTWMNDDTGELVNTETHNTLNDLAAQDLAGRETPQDEVEPEEPEMSPGGKLPKPKIDPDTDADLDSAEQGFEDLDDEAVERLNRIKSVIKGKMTKDDKRALLRDLMQHE